MGVVGQFLGDCEADATTRTALQRVIVILDVWWHCSLKQSAAEYGDTNFTFMYRLIERSGSWESVTDWSCIGTSHGLSPERNYLRVDVSDREKTFSASGALFGEEVAGEEHIRRFPN